MSRVGVIRHRKRDSSLLPFEHIPRFDKARGAVLTCKWTCRNTGNETRKALLKLYRITATPVLLATGAEGIVLGTDTRDLNVSWTVPNAYSLLSIRVEVVMEDDAANVIATHDQLVNIVAGSSAA